MGLWLTARDSVQQGQAWLLSGARCGFSLTHVFPPVLAALWSALALQAPQAAQCSAHSRCTLASLCTLCSHPVHTFHTSRFMNKEYVLSRQLYQDMPTTGRVGIMFGQEKSGEQQRVGNMVIGSRSRSTAREQQPVGTVSRK